MTRRFGLLYSVISVVVLLVLCGLLVGRLNTVRSSNLAEAEASYRRLIALTRTEVERARDVAGALRTYSVEVTRAEAIVLYSLERGIRYLWTADAATLRLSSTAFDGFRGFPEYRTSDVTHARLRDRLGVGSDLYLDAVYRVLTFTDAYPALRDTLIAILLFALLTAVAAFSLLALRRAHAGHDRAADRDETQQDPRRDAEQPTIRMPAETGPLERPAAQHDAREPEVEEVMLEEIATDPGEPGTLFSPVTGLSYRDHLERRLELELERAAFNDQDLSCLLVRFPDSTGKEAEAEDARAVLDTFKFEDLCFEYAASTCCVILPNCELNQAIKQAERFAAARSGRVLVGLSSRSGRLVEASRVLTETSRSLEHAATSKGGIVGFRPDPRKYRQFVTEQPVNRR